MSNETPAPEANLQPAEKRTPFNEVSVLFPLLSIYTAGYMGLMAADFLLKHSLSLPEGLLPVYIALLGAYAADKEIRRWMGSPEPPRKGSLFVYLWILFALAAFIIHSFRPEYPLPDKLISVCIQVLGIFFGSKASKYACERREGDGGAEPGREKMVMDIIRARGQITRQVLMDELGISRSVAGRLLAALENKGAIIRQGNTKGIYYVPGQNPPLA